MTDEVLLTKLRDLFEQQFPGLPVGGFHNPTLVSEDKRMMEFRCRYDNCDNDADSWTWWFDKHDRCFYN